MNSELLDTLIFLLECAAIYVVFGTISRLICRRTKFSGEKKTYLIILVTNIFCFSFFIIYGLSENYFGLRIKFLQALWFILTPISFLLLILSLYFFLTIKKKRQIHWKTSSLFPVESHSWDMCLEWLGCNKINSKRQRWAHTRYL